MPDLRFTRDVLLLSCGGCGQERQVDRTRGAEATAADTLRFCDAHLGCPAGSAVETPALEEPWEPVEGDPAPRRTGTGAPAPKVRRAAG
jgi:hypothetical protein